MQTSQSEGTWTEWRGALVSAYTSDLLFSKALDRQEGKMTSSSAVFVVWCLHYCLGPNTSTLHYRTAQGAEGEGYKDSYRGRKIRSLELSEGELSFKDWEQHFPLPPSCFIFAPATLLPQTGAVQQKWNVSELVESLCCTPEIDVILCVDNTPKNIFRISSPDSL